MEGRNNDMFLDDYDKDQWCSSIKQLLHHHHTVRNVGVVMIHLITSYIKQLNFANINVITVYTNVAYSITSKREVKGTCSELILKGKHNLG